MECRQYIAFQQRLWDDSDECVCPVPRITEDSLVATDRSIGGSLNCFRPLHGECANLLSPPQST
eukprot:19701-Eustigmatos_ZCMA.PRE.1